ncbi:HAMP domain-containing sensor histidine kinase [Sphingobacterium kyonggiense]|uniref:histidine kinase n=1 Tax=Sphingobacterium kyonggiense TaxID=714075 RepID=A0ABP7Z6Z3_9SPHI
MKLKHRLSLYSIAIFSVLTMLISVIIYFAYYVQREHMEEHALENKTLLAAIYYLEQDELSSLEHAQIQNQLQKTISRKNIAVFDSLTKQVDGDMALDLELPKGFFGQVQKNGKAHFNTDAFFYNGLYYQDNQGDFVVLARESKFEFNEQLQTLSHILILAFLAGLLVIYFFSRFLGYIAYQPIIKVIDQIKERDSQNFDVPIQLTKSYSEIQDLVNTYNHFVDRIAQTFAVQKNFIDYVSHELRTPITALMGTLEVTKQRARSAAEYEQVILQLQQYTNDLQDNLEQMMLLSGAKTSFEFQKLRMDEIVWQVIEQAVLYHHSKIDVKIEVQNPDLLTWEGNDRLLALALNNLIENAIKYSNNNLINIRLWEEENRLLLEIKDQGIGIPTADLEQVRQNFYRASNTKAFSGKGIGLSMANIIFKYHGINLEIESDSSGTRIILRF